MDANFNGKKPPPRLFVVSVLEPKDDLIDARHDRCFNLVSSMVTDKGEKEGNEALAAAVSKNDPKAHEDICVGLIVGILGEPELAARHYRDLTLVARDGLQAACNHITALVLEKYPKMYPSTRQQLLWLTREMIKSSVTSMENICWNLMRQIAGGDVSVPNLWLADNLLDIFIDHRVWLERFPFLLASVVYTYLRIIEDHVHQSVEKLREKEVKFVVSLMRERFTDVIVIGRDLLRVLQYVAKIPEFEQLWMDIIGQPKSLAPNFTGITQLMHTRTSRRFLQSRITPEMEKKLVFLTSQVRFGTHKRYQDWFQRQYLSTAESQSLRCDLIRFIVGVIHPTNELLGSDIIPRWAIIGWLLTTCTNQVASSNAKLALFYDWLFFTPDKDNIMNIEPAILVMHHSMRPHPAITATLLDFLCRIITNFYPKERDKVHAGISNSLRTILDKRVLPSLLPLFDNPRLDEELKLMLKERFPYFVTKDGEEGLPPILDREEDGDSGGDAIPRFSDDEEEEEEDRRQKEEKGRAVVAANNAAAAAVEKKKKKVRRDGDKLEEDGVDTTEELDEDVKDILAELKAETKDMAKKCEVMDNLIRNAIDKDYDFQQCSALASQLADVLQEEFEGRIFPLEPTPEAIEDSIGHPIFVAFRSLCEIIDSDPNRTTVLQLLAELYTLQPRIGYYLLYFLSADKAAGRNPKEKANVYRDLCEALDENFSLEVCLVNDMRQCQDDDVNLFVHLVPEIFTNFPKHSVGNTNLLYLVVSNVDGRQVQTLVCHILAKDFIMFKKDSFQGVLNSSLIWETFEQYALWQLAAAHDLPIDCVVPLVPKLSYSKHSEALTSVLLLLKQERPTAELLKSLMAREPEKGDRFVSSALTYWMHESHDKLGDLISSHLHKQASLGSSGAGGGGGGGGGSGGGGKRKRNQPIKNGTLSHSAELCLTHLDELRQNCRRFDFFNQRSIQSALQQVRHSCTDTQKKKYMDLFALADSDSEQEDSVAPPPKKKNSASGVGGNKSSSSSNSMGGGGSSGANKSPGKSKMSSVGNAAFKNSGGKKGGMSESSEESSDNSENERSSTSRSKSQQQQRGGGARGKNPRKRANKVSYKISSDDSSDDDGLLKKPPKKKKATHSESE